MHPLFFFLSFTWRHPRPECELQHPYSHFVYLLPLSVLVHLIWWREHFEAWGGGIGVTVRIPREAVCLDPLVKPLLAAFFLKKKIVFVCVSRANYTTHRQCTYKLVLACIVMHTHAHTPNLHGFDDAKQQEPLGAGCLDKTKQMFMCTMPS